MQISAILAFLEAEHIPFLFSGNLDTEVSAFSSLSRYKQNSLTWIKAQEYIPEGFDVSQITLAIASETVCYVSECDSYRTIKICVFFCDRALFRLGTKACAHWTIYIYFTPGEIREKRFYWT